MSTRRNALMLAGLLALPSCDAGDAAPAQSTIEPSAVAMNEAAPTNGETDKDGAVSRTSELAPTPTMANGNPSLRDSYSTCIDGTDGGTWDMQACIEKEGRYQDARLNAAYQLLRGTLSVAQQAQLRKEQRQWLFDRDHGEECRWDASTEGQAQRIAANECTLREVAIRATELEERASRRTENP